MHGLYVNRPAATVVAPETSYFATDTNQLYVSDGTNWQQPFPSASTTGVAPAWQAGTAYAQNAMVTFAGSLWIAVAAFTSGASFNPVNWLTADSTARNALSNGEETLPRQEVTAATLAVGSGTVRLTFFTARKSETINNIRGFTGGNGAVATPTLCRMGLYLLNSDSTLSLVAACANDTTLFAANSTAYTRALTASYAKVAGQRYAYAVLVVSGVATPTFLGATVQGSTALLFEQPYLCAGVGGQTDLPATVASGAYGISGTGMLYGEVTP